MPISTLRLNRYLAQLGVASRRKADEMISAGRISIAGKTIRELGFKVEPGTKGIEVDGVPLERSHVRKVYFLFHKPKNVVTTLSDPQGRPTVAEYFSHIRERVYPIGRLDYDTEGVIILTSDGEAAHRLMHPRFEVERVYEALVVGAPPLGVLRRLAEGIDLGDRTPARAIATVVRRQGSHSVVRLTLREGRKREVKRMLAAIGFPVLRLRRVSFAGVTVRGLKPGTWRVLVAAEIRRLTLRQE